MFELFDFLNFQKISQIHQKTQKWVAFLVRPFLIRDLNISTVKASSIQTKLVLDQKWGVLYDSEVHFSIRPIPRLTAPIFNFFIKKCFFFNSLSMFEVLTAPKFWRGYRVLCTVQNSEVSAFTSTKNQINWIKTRCSSQNWILLKILFFRSKICFFKKSANIPKNLKKTEFFSKKLLRFKTT